MTQNVVLMANLMADGRHGVARSSEKSSGRAQAQPAGRLSLALMSNLLALHSLVSISARAFCFQESNWRCKRGVPIMNPKAKEIVEQMRCLRADTQSRQTWLMGELLVLLAEEQEESAAVAERQTNKIVGLTWALVALTFVLFLLTAYLGYDVYLKINSDEKTRAAQKVKAESLHSPFFG
jgi:hypothetical protein